jgi:hypothetical protein
MNCRKSLSILFVSLCFLLAGYGSAVFAGNPHSAYYSSDNDKLFWFILVSDHHIGARGNQPVNNLRWVVTEGKNVINPEFIVSSGDLTDSTNGSTLALPDGPYQEEWDTYLQTLETNGVDASFYYDIPGNHDEYNDANLSYYLNNSIQGKATGQTQVSWTRTFDFGKYHFIGVCTAGNDGAPFSILPPDFGDHAGLDDLELSFIGSELKKHEDAVLSLIFGHHPLQTRSLTLKTWSETALTYGEGSFVQLMEDYGVSIYGYGHSHIYREEFFVKDMAEGVFYLNLASLGKSSDDQYNVVAIDCNGISTVSQDIDTWPVVLITAPLDRNLGVRNNPYNSNIPHSSSSPVRALVFDKNPVTEVLYRIDEKGTWLPMTRAVSNAYLWEAESSTTLWEGEHIVEVKATGTTTRTDRVPTASPAEPVSDSGGCFISTLK